MRLNLFRLRSPDWPLLIAMFTLVLFGLAAIYSVELSHLTSTFLNVKKQLVAAGIGILAFLFIASSNHHLLRNYAIVLYISGVLLLAGVLVFGETIRGTTGWYSIGPMSFQPVEYMKLALAVALAAYFSGRARLEFGLRELFESMGIAGIPVGLTMLQPDLGSALLLISLWGVVVLFAGIKKLYLLALSVLSAISALLAWQFLFVDYQKARILTFLNPAADPLGQGYNVTQAIIAVGSGGWVGRGLGFGSQSQLKFLPESQTDFIFAVIAEELGFVGVVLLLVAFMVLFWRVLGLASRTHDDFSGYMLIAIGGVLFAQTCVNLGMNLGLLPVTGVALPLVSYGGSSLVFTFIMVAVVQSVASRE
jgi:rod shape determining protein RodA